MTRAEAARILATLAAAYTRRIDEAQAQTWYSSSLERIDARLGMATAGHLVATEENPPTPARFNALARALRQPEPVPELPPGPTNPERRTALHQQIHHLRTTLANTDNRQHDHRDGWQDCPVCAKRT